MRGHIGHILATILDPKTMRHLADAAPYLIFIVLIGVILVGAWAIHQMRREDREQPDTPEDLLAQFGKARASGEMDEAEYRRVIAVLNGQSIPQPGALSADRARWPHSLTQPQSEPPILHATRPEEGDLPSSGPS